jgi:meso-butanediol dehydrogenase/(S,S)-butanediol dehydrogenase/diacetyl reductase
MAMSTPHIAIVTGGSRGIGGSIVERLHEGGAQVVTCGRGRRPPELPGDVRWVQADVAEPGAAERIVAEATDAFGPTTLLVNNAGVQVEKTVLESTDADWDLVVGTNCQAMFRMCRAVLPDMTRSGGVIVNIGSISATLADPSMALYNASKSFVHGLTRSIAVDHGPAVRCNTIAPGWITTDMADAAFALAADPVAAKRDSEARHPAGRLGKPADIANAVAWLASSEAAFVTGQCFTVDGGLTSASPLRADLF